jgi:hypothetical protein
MPTEAKRSNIGWVWWIGVVVSLFFLDKVAMQEGVQGRVLEAAGEKSLRLIEYAKERQGGGGTALLIYKEKLASAATMRRSSVSSFTLPIDCLFFLVPGLYLWTWEQTGNGVIGAHRRNPSIAPRTK